MINIIKETTFLYKGKGNNILLNQSKITNGSKFIVGGELSQVQMILHQHFNWFQKLMWKKCFGIKMALLNDI